MSDWNSIAGECRIEVRGGHRRVHDLLAAALEQTAAHSRRYHDKTTELAYGFRESQFHSVLFPALRDVCEVVFREQPLQRRRTEPGEFGGHGQLDYWLERGGRVTLLELKHQHVSLQSRKLTTWFWEQWDTLQSQLDDLMGAGGRSVFDAGVEADVVGLMVVPYYRKGGAASTSPASRGAVWELHQELLDQLLEREDTHPVTWSGAWLAPEDMRDWGDFFYPAVSWFAALPPKLHVG